MSRYRVLHRDTYVSAATTCRPIGTPRTKRAHLAGAASTKNSAARAAVMLAVEDGERHVALEALRSSHDHLYESAPGLIPMST